MPVWQHTKAICLEWVQILAGNQKDESSSLAWGDPEVVPLLFLT